LDYEDIDIHTWDPMHKVWFTCQVFEVFYVIDMLLNFITEFYDTETFRPVWTLREIANNYIFSGTFLFDLITMFPYQFFFDNVYSIE
jgi:hypothetical protein